LPVQYAGRLPQHVQAPAGSPATRELVVAEKVSKDTPHTRAAAFHVNFLDIVPIEPSECPIDTVCGGDGSNVGLPERSGVVFNPATSDAVKRSFALGSLVLPGQHAMTRLTGSHEGTYFSYSTGAMVGGEGDGGQIGLGLFGAVNVEPAGSRWYRSQVTHEVMAKVTRPQGTAMHPFAHVDYEAEDNGVPLLAILDKNRQIVHADVNAVVVLPEKTHAECANATFGASCAASFREFTVILHDEVAAEQAFPELADESNPLHYIKDGMGINYGVSSMGSLVMATQSQRAVGVNARCPECRAEEFFLSSWANGDPALILRWDGDFKKPVGAMYPDDPSNVHHSYLGDPVRFRNLHAGPKETHVFHLHAHQWELDSSDPNSTYLDSQTISPGATFCYGIEFGGAGNRNYTPGDSIFHCHLYPHFAQGMWELWRVHDAFEDGTPGPWNAVTNPHGRNLPDAEVAGGTENPALIPIPGNALAPVPTEKFPGYPFYIAGEAGHRPPQPPLDMDVTGGYVPASGVEPDDAQVVNGGLRRHVVTGLANTLKSPSGAADDPVVEEALKKGGEAAQLIAQRVYAQNKPSVEALARAWGSIYLKPLAHSGEPAEKAAMEFHEGRLADDSPPGARRMPVTASVAPHPMWWDGYAAYRTEWASTVASQQQRAGDDPLFHVNGRPRAAGAPFANPCPTDAPERHYRAAFLQTELTVNRHGWFDPQGRILSLENDVKDLIDPDTRSRLPEPLFFRANSGECIDFKSSNLVPSALNADDFQIYTPTDTIGQHIHLVKFDVTSSDGSANGWNYEDATFSPDEVRERIFAANRTPNIDGTAKTEAQKLHLKAHPLFMPGGDIYEHRADPRYAALYEKGRCPTQAELAMDDAAYEHELNARHPLCGAQRTTQRWWADPILVQQHDASGKPTGLLRDTTLRTVFTHDHLGPSSHQQHGLYAALVIEPANSVWYDGHTPAALQTDALPSWATSTYLGQQMAVLGGSDLAAGPLPQVLDAGPVLAPVKPAPPLVVRNDGGPTSTMATIVAPACLEQPDSVPFRLPRKNGALPTCKPGAEADRTRREFTLAFADFAGVYDTALMPINPETRDLSARLFGRRQVALQVPRPLAISSEDPGTQLINYRHEPLALRIADVTPDTTLGGFSYSQTPCAVGDQACTGDMANGLSSSAHARRDAALASTPYWRGWSKGLSSANPAASAPSADPAVVVATAAIDLVSPVTRAILQARGEGERLRALTEAIERRRADFTCALYDLPVLQAQAVSLGAGATGFADFVHHCESRRIEALEPWRAMGDPATPILAAFEGDPVQLRLIQGAQEAQHIFTMTGIKWQRVIGSRASGYTNAQPIGISEHFEFDVQAPGLDATHADYLYFGASIDQMWDGMWGLLRAFGEPRVGDTTLSSSKRLVPLPRPNDAGRRLSPIDRARTDADTLVCGDTEATRRYLDVSAVRACQLYGDCDLPGQRPTGITYSHRFDIRDPDALVYVLSHEGDGKAGGQAAFDRSNEAVLAALRSQFTDPAHPRPLEPMVMRARAGQCMAVKLRNHLPPVLDDGPAPDAQGHPQTLDSRAFHNLLPMIADGFNINQYRMSSSVGLAAPRVAQHPLHAAGSNVGLNDAVAFGRAGSAGSTTPPNRPGPRVLGGPAIGRRQMQGSLVPPCAAVPTSGASAGAGAGASSDAACQATWYWSATDFKAGRDGHGASNAPVELGALPLSSFADPIKHPAHGLVGALVIEPADARRCSDDRYARPWPGGVSAEWCRARPAP
ncbi:MAG: putative multicopper oxidase, partial [Rhizobacter sp.]|nr:putative multicopper oxidase [Rhizobacter sp.]